MKIKTKDLILILRKIEVSILERFPEYIEINDEDFYWDINEDDMYDPYKNVSDMNITLGQLSFDWENLARLLEDESLPASFDLKTLSSIVKVIGHKGVW